MLRCQIDSLLPPSGLVPGRVGRVLLWLWAVTRGRLWDTDNASFLECASIPDLHGFDHDIQLRGRTTGNPADSLHCTELDTRKCRMEHSWYLLYSHWNSALGSVGAFTNGPVLLMVLTVVIDAARPCERSRDMTEVNSAVFTSVSNCLIPTFPTFKEV